MTRFWSAGQSIQVEIQGDEPVQLTLYGVSHRVMHVVRRWRIDEGWWDRRIWRDYFKLHTHNGWLMVIYHDLLSDKWFVQRLYD